MIAHSIDIAVIGGGPAGLSAAKTTAEAGATVLLVESRSWVGGRLALQTQPLQGPATVYGGLNGVEFCRRFSESAASAGVEIRPGMCVSRLEYDAASRLYQISCDFEGTSPMRIQARAVVLATGSNEPEPRFPGSHLQGVMLAGDAQEMLNVHGRLPGKRVLMVGSDNAGLLVAANLRDAGAVVVAVIDESPRIAGREFNAAPLRDAGVEFLTGSKVIRACGKGYLERIVVGALDGEVVPIEGAERTFDVDTICVAGDRTSELTLALAAGVPEYDSPFLGGSVPVRSRDMSTPMPNLFVCGDGAGVENGAVALETGLIAGLNASISTGWTHPDADRLKRRARARIGYLRQGRRGAARREAEQALANVYRRLAKTPDTL